ncbi:MAG: sugar phosphate isomerase/epimerase [Phycisphaerales bacterium]|nr:sugar phosphate isomerase/epimerase [Phycisphaerales bacterium]MCB9863123.1 sugar phosphate isomerase/epimerase [Phycisphaerales bacterium]
MKLAFSSVACPNWNLATMVEKAKEYGYEGIELRGLEGQMHLPLAPQIASNPGKVADLMDATGVSLICLSTSAAFHYQDREQVAKNQAEVRQYIELAGKLRCPFVRVFGSEIPRMKFSLLGFERRETTMHRIAEALRELAVFAARHKVTLLIENNGDFTDSVSMWYIVDAVDSPGLRCCWNPFNAMTRGERPTRSIPRLGARIGLIHLTDGKFNDGTFDGFALPGDGNLELHRFVQLLKGIAYRGYICLDWPKLWEPGLAEPDVALSKTAAVLKPMIAEEPVALSAYKGDKFLPKYANA